MAEIVLLSALDRTALAPYARALGEPVVVGDLPQLQAAAGGADAVLVSFSTGVIVPAAVIARFGGGAYNVHPASPDYPGRDPHHFAVYDGAPRYGATMHVMTPRVDDGPIVDVELFDTPPAVRPRGLLDLAYAAALRICERAGPRLIAGQALPPLAGAQWGPNKRSRADFLALCRIDPNVSAAEFERRLHAFDGEGYANLYTELHGRRFRIEAPQAGRDSR